MRIYSSKAGVRAARKGNALLCPHFSSLYVPCLYLPHVSIQVITLPFPCVEPASWYGSEAKTSPTDSVLLNSGVFQCHAHAHVELKKVL